MRILGIETSCDETALAVVEEVDGRLVVRQNLVYSQAQKHEEFGGVVPEVAARLHMEKLMDLVAEVDVGTVDVIAVTAGPGLPPALRVGVECAKTMAWLLKKPLVPVSHMEGHIYANWLVREGWSEPEFPIVVLLVSGGHTEFILMKGHGQFERLGETIDDAAGEAFDKVAHMLGLPYPGGPQVAKLALRGDVRSFDFPRAMRDSAGYEVSFSGLKTAVLYALRENEERIEDEGFRADIAASFEEAVVDVLTAKMERATLEFSPKALIVAGGVSANVVLRERMEQLAAKHGVKFLVPEFAYTLDNASMIAAAGYFRRHQAVDPRTLASDSHLDFTKL